MPFTRRRCGHRGSVRTDITAEFYHLGAKGARDTGKIGPVRRKSTQLESAARRIVFTGHHKIFAVSVLPFDGNSLSNLCILSIIFQSVLEPLRKCVEIYR